MAGQNPNNATAILRNQLQDNTFVHALYPLLTPRQALNLNRSVGMTRPAADYNACDTTCQSYQPPPFAAPHNDFETLFTYFMHPHLNLQNGNPTNNLYLAQVGIACTARASYTHAVTGQMEPSYCLLPHNHPINNMHAHPNRLRISNEPLVCLACKANRG
jgi:hypothetical protein